MDRALEILREVRRIAIAGKRKAASQLGGEYSSSFRGQGLDFDEFRAFSYGDEPRYIDWKITARTNTPYVRKFHEDRQRSLIFVVDCSSSMHYGSQRYSKQEYAAMVVATMAYSAIMAGDKVGLLLFASRPVLYLSPSSAQQQVLRLIREILEVQPLAEAFDSDELRGFLMNTLRKRACVVLVSDFMFKAHKQPLAVLAVRHELIALGVFDQCEAQLPDAGLVLLQDLESGQLAEVDLGNSALREFFQQQAARLRQQWSDLWTSLGMDACWLDSSRSPHHALGSLLRRRSARHLI